MRRLTDQQVIKRFMDELGATVRGPGHVFFTGGVSAVLMGWRTQTVDIDLSADPEPAGLFEAMPRLKELLDVNLEQAGLTVPPIPANATEAELRLYRKLGEEHGVEAYTQYNALLRRLSSFCRALEGRQQRAHAASERSGSPAEDSGLP